MHYTHTTVFHSHLFFSVNNNEMHMKSVTGEDSFLPHPFQIFFTSTSDTTGMYGNFKDKTLASVHRQLAVSNTRNENA
jgi:hypothetical protein